MTFIFWAKSASTLLQRLVITSVLGEFCFLCICGIFKVYKVIFVKIKLILNIINLNKSLIVTNWFDNYALKITDEKYSFSKIIALFVSLLRRFIWHNCPCSNNISISNISIFVLYFWDLKCDMGTDKFDTTSTRIYGDDI